MFVALLLVGRLFELRSRQVAAEAIDSVTRELPALAERLESCPRPAESVTVRRDRCAPVITCGCRSATSFPPTAWSTL